MSWLRPWHVKWTLQLLRAAHHNRISASNYLATTSFSNKSHYYYAPIYVGIRYLKSLPLLPYYRTTELILSSLWLPNCNGTYLLTYKTINNTSFYCTHHCNTDKDIWYQLLPRQPLASGAQFLLYTPVQVLYNIEPWAARILTDQGWITLKAMPHLLFNRGHKNLRQEKIREKEWTKAS